MFINLTPHKLNILDETGVRVIPPSGNIARVETSTVALEPIDGIPVVRTKFEDVVGLPAPEEGVYYVVSRLVCNAVTREDVYTVGEVVRDDDGKPVGCRGLAR